MLVIPIFRNEEDAVVGVGLSEAELLEPREESALPAATGLCHAVDGLEDAADLVATVSTLVLVARRGEAVDRLTFEELALQVGGDEVVAPHAHPGVGGQVGEHTE